MSTTARPILEVTDLKKHFPIRGGFLGGTTGYVYAVDGVSFEIARGETLSLVGESGCGKSTVARLIAGLYAPTEGAIEFRGRRLQMIFQDPYASLNPRWRVRKIVAEPMMFLPEKKPVEGLLRQVGLSPDDAERYPHEFSGGQRQRISIARALAGEPELLICDEPTSALDVSVQAQILNLMAELQERLGLTYLFISHNLAVVSLVADRVGVMYLGRIVELARAAELFSRPRHPYTRMLLDAVPDLGMSGKPRTPVRGEVPNPLAPPSGCTFHPRCPHANERCRREVPQVIDNVACHAVEEGRT
jgi:peptide/nickel transport system ATP-binding protein